MPIESDKPNKICVYCNKEIKNLGLHIINAHPSILEQLEEKTPNLPQGSMTPQQSPSVTTSRPLSGGDTRSMIREKLEAAIDIKLLQMLEKGASVEEINRVINPPPVQSQKSLKEQLEELNEFNKLLGNRQVSIETSDGSGDKWTEVLIGLVPTLLQMFANKKQPMEAVKNVEHRTNEIGSVEDITTLSGENGSNREESSNIGKESKSNIGTIESIDFEPATIDKSS